MVDDASATASLPRGSVVGPVIFARGNEPLRQQLATSPTTSRPPISTADELLEQVRDRLHTVFTRRSPSVAATDLDDCSHQAFRFLTTTNTISSEAFHHKVLQLKLHASRKLCLELFDLIDREDVGEIPYSTFARRLFLPAAYFTLSKSSPPPEAAAVTRDRFGDAPLRSVSSQSVALHATSHRHGANEEPGSSLTIQQLLTRLRDAHNHIATMKGDAWCSFQQKRRSRCSGRDNIDSSVKAC